MIFNRNFFYNLLSVATIFCCANSLFAQGTQATPTIQVVAVESTFGFEKPAQEVIKQDVQNFTSMLQRHVAAEHLKIYKISGSQATPENILQLIDSINPAPQDTMVFYYSGHGANDPNVAGAYFQVVSNKGTDAALHRVAVKNAMLKKGAHLNVIFTDCCNVFEPVTINTKQTRALSIPPSGFSPIIECLFVKPTGVVDVTTSRIGQFSYTAGGGSIGTIAFIDTLDSINTAMLSQKVGNQSWISIKETFLFKSHDLFKKIYPNGSREGQQTQTPHFYETPAVRFGVRVISLMQGDVQVTEVLPDSPGSKAGIKVGDVITHINDEPVLNEYDYGNAVDKSSLDMKITLKDKAEPIHARLQENVEVAPIEEINATVTGSGTATPVPGTQAVPGTGTATPVQGTQAVPGTGKSLTTDAVPGIPVFGVTLDFKIKKGEITKVVIGSPADKCGLEKGDCIVQVNRTIINSTQDFDKAVDESPVIAKLLIVDQKTGEHKEAIIRLNK